MELPKTLAEQVELLIFDLDGTIINLDVDWYGLKQELRLLCVKNYNYCASFAFLDQELSLVKSTLGFSVYHQLIKVVTRYEIKGVKLENVRKDMIDFIRLNQEKKLAICSSNTRQTILRVLEESRISYFFDCVVGKEDIERPKPAPEGLRKILDVFNLPAEKAVYIGDSSADELAGINAGVLTLLV
jgi:pyrophosphatase PpaX